jgi:hypothetical protein
MKASQDSFVSAGISGVTAVIVGPMAFMAKGVNLWWAVSLMAAGVVLVLAGFAGYRRLCANRRSSSAVGTVLGFSIGICLIAMTVSCGWALELPAARLGAWWKLGLLVVDTYAVYITARVIDGCGVEPTRA